MYKKSKDVTMHKIFLRNTKVSRRILFKTDSYQGSLYKRSLYFVVSNLWDTLSLETIDLPDNYSFKTRIKRLNCQYVDLLT